MEYLNSYNLLISNLTLLAHVGLVGFILLYVFQRKLVNNFIKKFYIQLTGLFSLAAFAGSMFYSNVIGFQPCSLCYWQRIFMYPILLLSIIALIKKDKLNSDYFLGLSGVGLLISAYHIYIQFIPNPLPCNVSGQGVSCTDNWVLEYGYITIPVMAATCFAWVFVVNLINKTNK